MPYAFYALNAKVVLSSKMKDVHQEKIKSLQAQLLPEMEALREMRKVHQEEDEALRDNQEFLSITTARHKTCMQMREFLKFEWSCHTYKAFRDFYKRGSTITHSPDVLVKEFQICWLAYIKENHM